MFGVRLSKMGSASKLGLIAKAIGILRKYGADAHVYLPGIGTVSGLTAGNYLDSAGVTAASVDNPVGLSLDALQAMTLGPERVTNGTFDANISGWVDGEGGAPSWVTGAIQRISTTGGGSYQDVTVTANTSYVVSVGEISKVSGTGAVVWGVYDGAAFTNSLTGTVSGVQSMVVKPSTSVLRFYLYNDGSSVGRWDNISVREIPGIHATQATTANKPILRRGLLNLATWSMDVSNAAWTANVAGSASAIARTPSYTTSPDGYPATRIQTSLNSGTATGDISYLYQSVIPSTTICTGGIYIKSNTTDCSMYMRIGNSEYTIAVTSAWTLIPNVCPAGNTSSQFGFGLRGGQSSPCSNSIDVSIASAGLFQGTYTAQQILDAGGIPLTTSAAASSATGKYWWQFDGSNDSLSLSAPLFQMSDDHCVIAGFNASSAANYSVIFNPAYVDGTSKGWNLLINQTAGGVIYQGYDGTNWRAVIDPASAVGLNTVATAFQLSGVAELQVNGVSKGTTTTPPIPITCVGARIGASSVSGGSLFTGSIYPVIAIKGAVSAADRLVLTRFVGQLSGVSGI